MTRSLVAVLIAAAAATAAPAPPAKPPAKALNLYPLQAGNKWEYEVEVGGQTQTATMHVAKVEKVDGKELARLEAEVAGAPAGTTEHLAANEKGVFRHRFNGAEIDPPVCLIQYPFKAGTTWETKMAFGALNLEVKASAGDPTTVEVPAGKFKAYPVQLETEQGGVKIQTTYYFAEDVGVVSQTFQVGETTVRLQLKKFTPGGKDGK